MSFTLIETREDLSFLNKELLGCSCLGVDTEFRRTTKDNMKLALLQVNDSTEIYLIDCLQIKEPKEICSFLSSQDTKKIFHSCREDIEAIYSWTKQGVLNIYDTQIANSLLAGSFSISYQALVKEKIGLVVSKDETRTNWLRRPLTESQLNYAAFDVYYLIDLYNLQIEEFSKTNKLEWLEEESNKYSVLDSCIELPRDKVFDIQKKEEKEILIEFNNMVNKISRIEGINPTLFFSKQNQRLFILHTLYLGLEDALQGITIWRRRLIQENFSALMKRFGIS